MNKFKKYFTCCAAGKSGSTFLRRWKSGILIGIGTMLMSLSDPALAWTPTNMTTALWIDAADTSTLTLVNGCVSQWNDKSGNNRHMLQPTAANQPTNIVAGLNGLATIRTVTSDYMTNNPTALLRNVGAATVIVVAKYTSGAQNADSVLAGVYTANTRFALRNNSNVGVANKFSIGGRRLDADAFTSVSSTSQILGSWFIEAGSVTYTSAKANHWTNGSQDLTNATFQTAGNTSDTAARGSIFNTDVGLSPINNNTELAEVVIMHSDSTSDRQRIEGYLAWKWGLTNNLPVGHPWKTINPITWKIANPYVHRDYSMEQTVAKATGGNINRYTQNGTNWIAHIFTNASTTATSIVFSVGGNVEVLVVGGGGGGGGKLGGGGGGGAVVWIPSASLTVGSHAVTVGSGGTAGVGSGGKGGYGGTSSVDSVSAAGGGGGGYYAAFGGNSGGSGGGAGAVETSPSTSIGGLGYISDSLGVSGHTAYTNGSSTGSFSGTIYGSAGGDVTNARTGIPGQKTNARGGGGAGVAATSAGASDSATAGAGGDGVSNSILGVSYYWGGGGGGAAYDFTEAVSPVGGAGGKGGGGGGGSGTVSSPSPTGGQGDRTYGYTATAGNGSSASGNGAGSTGGVGGKNTGGGGGGSSYTGGAGGAGGSGIVIVRYAVPQPPPFYFFYMPVTNVLDIGYPVANYRLDSTEGLTNSGLYAGAHNLTNYNAVVSNASGKACMYFNGSNADLREGNFGKSDFTNFTSGFTVSAWVYSTDTTDNDGIFGLNNTAATDDYIWSMSCSSVTNLRYRVAAGGLEMNSYSGRSNTWINMLATYQTAGSTNKFYTNGVLVAQYDAGLDAVVWTNKVLVVGNYYDMAYRWKGYIRDIMVWSNLITDTQITNVYTRFK